MIAVIVRSGMQISPGHSRSIMGAMGYRYRLISARGVRDESDAVKRHFNQTIKGPGGPY